MENSFINSGKAYLVALILFVLLWMFSGCGLVPADSQYVVTDKVAKKDIQ